MKRKFYLLITASCCMIALSNCSKEKNIEFIEPGDSNVQTFVSVIEAGVTGKTELTSANKVLWLSGDQINLFAEGTSYMLETSDDGANASFTGNVPVASEYYALYPYNASASINSGIISTSLPSSQKPVAGGIDDDLNIMVAHANDNQLSFKNVCSIIRINISRSDITSLKLASTDGSALAGDVTIDYNSGEPSITSVTNPSSFIILEKEDGSALAAGTYAFVILPSSLNGFKLSMNAKAQRGTFSTDRSIAALRNKIISVTGNIDTGASWKTDLSWKATANSYICGANGEYCFNATVKGNSSESVGTPVSAAVVWSTVSGMVSNVSYSDGEINFTLEKNGNVLLAAKDASDKILWSWHIYAPTEAISDEVYTSYFGKTYYVMNRNFGAMKSREGTDCLLYQWGRKDPLPNVHGCFVAGTGSSKKVVEQWPPVAYTTAGSTNDAIIQYTIANPMVFITSSTTAAPNSQSWMATPDFNMWGDRAGFAATYQTNGGWAAAKTIYDPCPPGYRVANVNTFSGFTTTGANSNNTAEFNVVNTSWGSGASGYWLFKRTATDTEGTYWPNTATRNPGTGVVERGTQAEHWVSNTTGNTGTQGRYLQVYASRVYVKGSCNTAYGHALRCARYASEANTLSSDYTPE